MVTPVIAKKTENQLTVNDSTKKLFRLIYDDQNKETKSDDEVPRIKVSSIISKMAFYYEKIRNAVDYEEEHLLRKNAIERILKRYIIIGGAITMRELNSGEIAKHLLVELIRAGYLPNNEIPEFKIEETEKIIRRFLKFRDYILQGPKDNGQDKSEQIKWIIALMATEIEEKLGRNKTDLLIINSMKNILDENILLPKDSKYVKDLEIQITIGIYRKYFKFDRDMLSYVLFKFFVSNWNDLTEDEIKNLAGNITDLQERIDYQIEHPLVGQLNRIISRYTIYFTILKEVVEENPVSVYEMIKNDPKAFPRQIKKICEHRYRLTRTKLWRAAVRSIIYIFITKSVFAVLLEVPAMKWFGEEINPISLAINITFPAALLFLVILFTKVPSEDNSSKIVDGINEIVFEEHEKKEQFQLRKPVKRGAVLSTVFGILYAITFFLSFGFVIWALNKINFSWVSIIIFLFFLAFVSFFSTRIRKNAKELRIVEPKENIFTLLADFFYIPIVSAGKWMSEKFDKVNVFVFVLDFFIEAPFKIFVEIAEEWTKYVKERKDEII
jgi:hypothetical protein